MAYTRAQFRDIIRERLGWPLTDTFVSDSEMNSYIQDSLRELHALKISIHGQDFGWTDDSLSVTAGSDTYLLPTEFGRLLQIHLQDGSQSNLPFIRGNLATHVFQSDTSAQRASWNAGPIYYFLQYAGDNAEIMFDPRPGADYTLRIFYSRRTPQLTQDSDTSWLEDDEYVILDVCAKCRVKEESDSAPLLLQKQAYREMLTNLAKPIDLGQPTTVADVRALRYDVRAYDGFWPPGVR